ncbi:NAD-dependent epimerase/dehydratase family protein [Leifsonia sp. AG29]|uniref:NAD-dependent epimerase/dehydratase family protein n=1 Tax=Leifsonia sp. AG29 TaxID=2598860 RepID=UPI00131E3854|nr:NAD(P)-dependent oxidoreductase [Leifsonia sp. AG29]
MNAERILVTGGGGLIGRAVVRVLRERGADVIVLDAGDRPAGDELASDWITGSVTDLATVERAVSTADRVVHLAGRAGLDQGTGPEIYETNTLGTFLVIDAAARAGVRSIVYASSINANGLPLNPHAVLPQRYPWDEDEPPAIADPYSLSKHANEAAALAIHRRYDVAVVGLRYPLVRDITVDEGTVFARHVRAAMRDDPRRQACEGWTYLDVRDAATATVLALTSDAPAWPGILVANPNTYLREPTETALVRFAPAVPRDEIRGRAVPVSLARAERDLGFRATVHLEDLGEDLLVGLEEVAA